MKRFHEMQLQDFLTCCNVKKSYFLSIIKTKSRISSNEQYPKTAVSRDIFDVENIVSRLKLFVAESCV